MLRSHGLYRLKLSPTKKCKELTLPKGVLLKVGGGKGPHLCIAQLGILRESWCIFVILMNDESLYDVNEET